MTQEFAEKLLKDIHEAISLHESGKHRSRNAARYSRRNQTGHGYEQATERHGASQVHTLGMVHG